MKVTVSVRFTLRVCVCAARYTLLTTAWSFITDNENVIAIVSQLLYYNYSSINTNIKWTVHGSVTEACLQRNEEQTL